MMDLGKRYIKIREAIDSIEIRGVDQKKKNAPYLSYAYERCNAIIRELNEIAEGQLQERQNGVKEGRETDGRSDRSVTELPLEIIVDNHNAHLAGIDALLISIYFKPQLFDC